MCIRRRRWPPSVSRDDGCTRLSRCRPGRVVLRSWSAQLPGPHSRRCWQGPTERQADTVSASAAAGVCRKVLQCLTIHLRGSTPNFRPGFTPLAFDQPRPTYKAAGHYTPAFLTWRSNMCSRAFVDE